MVKNFLVQDSHDDIDIKQDSNPFHMPVFLLRIEQEAAEIQCLHLCAARNVHFESREKEAHTAHHKNHFLSRLSQDNNWAAVGRLN